MDHIDVGINTYRVLIHRHKDQNADLLISDLKGKDPDTILRADLAALMFTPLMSGLTTQKERVLESAKLLQQEYPAVPGEDRKKMLAVLYVLATKFLTVEEMNEVKEVFSMNPLGKMIFDEVCRAAGLTAEPTAFWTCCGISDRSPPIWGRRSKRRRMMTFSGDG